MWNHLACEWAISSPMLIAEWRIDGVMRRRRDIRAIGSFLRVTFFPQHKQIDKSVVDASMRRRK